MKFLCYYPIIFFLFAILLPACKTSKAHSTKDTYYQQLSSEIENSEKISPLNLNALQIKNAPDRISKKEKENYHLNKQKKTAASNSKIKNVTSPQKSFFFNPVNPHKYDNIFWKIGAGFMTVGLVVLLVSGSLFLKLGFLGLIFLFGVLLGFALIFVAMPFLVIGSIKGTQENKSRDEINPREKNTDEKSPEEKREKKEKKKRKRNKPEGPYDEI